MSKFWFIWPLRAISIGKSKSCFLGRGRLGPRNSNHRACWEIETRGVSLVVRQIVVEKKRNFCWCWFSLVCWIRHISNVDYYINRWSWTDFIVDVEKRCWTAHWLLMLVVILIRWILHYSAYHTPCPSKNSFVSHRSFHVVFVEFGLLFSNDGTIK